MYNMYAIVSGAHRCVDVTVKCCGGVSGIHRCDVGGWWCG
jgi:hypothetical protein